MNHISKPLTIILILWFSLKPDTAIDAGDECFTRNKGKEVKEALQTKQRTTGERSGENSEEAVSQFWQKDEQKFADQTRGGYCFT